MGPAEKKYASDGPVRRPSSCRSVASSASSAAIPCVDIFRRPLQMQYLVPEGVTQAALAEKIGWTKARLNELIKGKRGITAAAAFDLADTLETSRKLWMDLQATLDLDKAAKARRVA